MSYKIAASSPAADIDISAAEQLSLFGEHSDTRLTRDDLTKRELAVIDDYVADDYIESYAKEFGHQIGPVGLVRAAQQGKAFKNSEKYKVNGDIVESVIERGESDSGIIYRGVNISSKDFAKYRNGLVFDQRGTSSWSSADGEALRFATRRDVGGEVSVLFRMVGGGKALDIGGVSKYNEGEWLMSRKRKMRAVSDPYEVNTAFGRVQVIDVEGV